MTATKTMPCFGELKMPSSYIPMDAEEMEYTEGGRDEISYKTAGAACTYLNNMYNSCLALSLGMSVGGGALGLASLGLTAVIGMVGGVLYGLSAAQYNGAFKECVKIKDKYGTSQRVKITETMSAVHISSVVVTKA